MTPHGGTRAATAKFREARLTPIEVSMRRDTDGSLRLRPDIELAPYPEKLTLRLEHWAREAPGRVFLGARENGVWREVTYAEALQAVRRIGAALLARGLSAERGIAILSGNDIEHALLGLAAQYVGIPYTPISTAYSLVSGDFGKLRHVIAEVTPGLVFAADGSRFERALAAAVPAGTEIVVTRNPPALLRTTPFAELAAPVTAAVDAAHAAVGPETIAKLLYTSGSTGLPKGVINTQRMLCSNQQMLAQVFAFLDEAPPVLVDWLPWSHCFGGNHNFNLALWQGGSFYIDEGRPVGDGIAATVANLREIGPTFYFNVPRGYEALLPHLREDRALRERFFGRMKALFYAGAALSPATWEALGEVAVAGCGERITFVTSLGSTETAPAALICNRRVDRPGIVGVPAPGVELKLVPVGEKLEMRVRGPHITPGYWRRPDLTAAAFDAEGFYAMGDALRLVDPERPSLGFMFDGRIAEDFKLATGTWVSVSAVRAEALRHLAPLVADIVIAGHDRDEIGVLLVPDLADCAGLCGVAPGDAAAVLRHPALRARLEEVLNGMAARATGTSNRIARAMLLEEPPSLDAGEVTDKGSLSQRVLLRNRAALVEELYAEPLGPRVIRAAP